MSTIKDEEELYQNLKNISLIYVYIHVYIYIFHGMLLRATQRVAPRVAGGCLVLVITNYFN